MSDFYFNGYDGSSEQYSRKQAGELLGDVDEAESQLRKYYPNADRNYQIVEGIISPIKLKGRKKDELTIRSSFNPDKLFTYQVAANGFFFNEHVWSRSYTWLQAWLHSLDLAGITTYFTLNTTHTARLLVANYNVAQHENRQTLQRVTKPRIHLRTQDTFVRQLVYLSAASDLGIGEIKAEALRAAGFRSILDLAMAEVDDLVAAEGIGKGLAEKILKKLGRDVEHGN